MRHVEKFRLATRCEMGGTIALSSRVTYRRGTRRVLRLQRSMHIRITALFQSLCWMERAKVQGLRIQIHSR